MILIVDKEQQPQLQPLVEMARFKGFGITLEVRSDDHGKFGNKGSPAHAHVLDNSGKEIAEIELTTNSPKKPSDIVWYRTSNPSKGLADKIIKLVNSLSKTAKKAGVNLTIWQNTLNLWFTFQEG